MAPWAFMPKRLATILDSITAIPPLPNAMINATRPKSNAEVIGRRNNPTADKRKKQVMSEKIRALEEKVGELEKRSETHI